MSAAVTFEEPVPGQSDESLESSPSRRVAIYGFVLVGGIAVGETAWLAAIGYALYRLFS